MDKLKMKSERLIFSSEGHSLLKVSLSLSKLDYFFIIDTGSSLSYFFDDPKGLNLQQINIPQEKHELIFEICNEKFKHTFVRQAIKRCKYIKGNKIIGIIGSDFLRKYNCVIDYKNELFVWRNKIKPAKKTKFSYPIHVGHLKLGVPIVGMGHMDSIVCCIIDTGANVNIVTKSALVECTFINKSFPDRTKLDIFGRNCLAYPYQVSFNLVRSSECKYTEVSYSCLCYASNELDELLFSINKRFPIGAILGNDFLRQNQWIIDFGSNLMYSF